MTLIGIRVDGGHAIGLGHVYKTLWLGRTLRDKGCHVQFLATEDPIVSDLIDRDGFPVHWFASTLSESEKVEFLNQWVKSNHPSALIIDHWDWVEAYWNKLKLSKETVFVAVDVPSEGFEKFDLAFQGIRNSLKNEEFVRDGCAVYKGPKYLMAPPHYLSLAQGWKPSGKLENILLSFGGTDVADFSNKVLDRFEKLSGPYNLTLISGPGSSNHNKAKEKAGRSRHNVEVLKEVSDLPERMCRSDLAITTAGLGTISELALTGTPAIVLAAVDHQVENANKFKVVGGIFHCAHKAGELDKSFDEHFCFLADNPKRLEQMSRNWKGLVDAKGIARMSLIILEQIQRGR